MELPTHAKEQFQISTASLLTSAMSAIQPESTGVLRGAVLTGQGNILESINRAAWAKKCYKSNASTSKHVAAQTMVRLPCASAVTPFACAGRGATIKDVISATTILLQYYYDF